MVKRTSEEWANYGNARNKRISRPVLRMSAAIFNLNISMHLSLNGEQNMREHGFFIFLDRMRNLGFDISNFMHFKIFQTMEFNSIR